MIESGVKDFVSMSFTGLLAPAGVPREVITTLNAAVNAALRSSETSQTLEKLGVQPRPGSPEDFAAFLAKENQLWASVAKSAGIRIE